MSKTCRVAVFEHIPAVTEASRNHYQEGTIADSKALGIEFEVRIKTTEEEWSNMYILNKKDITKKIKIF